MNKLVQLSLGRKYETTFALANENDYIIDVLHYDWLNDMCSSDTVGSDNLNDFEYIFMSDVNKHIRSVRRALGFATMVNPDSITNILTQGCSNDNYKSTSNLFKKAEELYHDQYRSWTRIDVDLFEFEYVSNRLLQLLILGEIPSNRIHKILDSGNVAKLATKICYVTSLGHISKDTMLRLFKDYVLPLYKYRVDNMKTATFGMEYNAGDNDRTIYYLDGKIEIGCFRGDAESAKAAIAKKYSGEKAEEYIKKVDKAINSAIELPIGSHQIGILDLAQLDYVISLYNNNPRKPFDISILKQGYLEYLDLLIALDYVSVSSIIDIDADTMIHLLVRAPRLFDNASDYEIENIISKWSKADINLYSWLTDYNVSCIKISNRNAYKIYKSIVDNHSKKYTNENSEEQ